MDEFIRKTDADWQAQLSPEEYSVTRRKTTERPFTGRYWDHWQPGIYRCLCCGAELFDSATKFDAGCGWPSFWAAAKPGAIRSETDHSHFMVRTEILCARCDAHLGHVFDDGPQPSGLRYCVNSASLDFADRSATNHPTGDQR